MDDICATCNRYHGVDEYTPVHPFRPKGSPAILNAPDDDMSDGVEITPQRFPFDPVLRQALITKGVITIDDIRDAEAMILVTTGQFQDALREVVRDEHAS